MQCLSPVPMYYVGVNPNTGKRRLTAVPSRYNITSSEPDIMVPCGKCIACLENRRNVWSRRLEMETWVSPLCTFITLTYDDVHLPPDGLASRKDVQKFVKRLRHLYRDYSIELPYFKYYIVSEYGALHNRPHYHGVLFGVDCFDSRWCSSVACVKDGYRIFTSSVLASLWSNGFVSFDKVTPSSIRYISKYITKSSSGNFALYSRFLGLPFLLQDGVLTSAARSAVENGFISYRSANGFYKSGLPRWFDRYLEKFSPFDYELVKSRRADYAASVSPDLRLSADRSVVLRQRLSQEQQRRKLDNES